MGDDRQESRVSLRLTGERLAWIDATADLLGTSRSELMRDGVDQLRQLQDDSQARQASLVAEERAQIEESQQLRQLLPSKWRAHIRGLFEDDLKDDVQPSDLEIMAKRYRKQAETKEELAAEIDDAPEADLVAIVDEELQDALEAADLSTWYDDVENPHERALQGVEDGQSERAGVVGAIRGAVQTGHSMAGVQGKVTVTPGMLGDMVETLLPDGVTREDVADVATELVRQGVQPEDVPGAIPTTDPRLEPEAIEAQPDDVDDGPQVVETSELTQEQLASLPAADGGRSDGSPFKESDEDTDMEPDNTDSSDDSIEFDQPEDVDERFDELLDATPEAEKAGEADG